MSNIMRRYPYLVILEDGIIKGYAYAGSFGGRAAYDRSCEMTIYLDRSARKCGMGRMIYIALQKIAPRHEDSQPICPHRLSRA